MQKELTKVRKEYSKLQTKRNENKDEINQLFAKIETMKISHKQKLENREAQYQLQGEINLMEQDTYRKMGQDIVD